MALACFEGGDVCSVSKESAIRRLQMLDEYERSGDRAIELNAWLSDLTLTDTNCYDLFRTSPRKRSVGAITEAARAAAAKKSQGSNN